MKRGVGMCGIGKEFGTVKCGKVSGTTDAPPTTTVRFLKKLWSYERRTVFIIKSKSISKAD